jgi:hypothetical protein
MTCEAMKRPLNGSPVIDWTQQDRQPDWQEKEDEDPDGDDFILESRRQQQRLVTPVKSDCGDEEPPGAPKKKRRILPWTTEGRVKRALLWPASKQTTTVESKEESSDDEDDSSVSDEVDGDVVQVDDSQVEVEDSDDDTGTEGTEETKDDLSQFVVDDDSSSVQDEEEESERSLGRGALEEVRAGILEKIDRLEEQLASVDKELSELASEGSDTEVSSGESVPVRPDGGMVPDVALELYYGSMSVDEARRWTKWIEYRNKMRRTQSKHQ